MGDVQADGGSVVLGSRMAGRPVYFYWDDEASRRLRPELLIGEQAEQQTKEFAQAERRQAR
jgi:hypothetical protein